MKLWKWPVAFILLCVFMGGISLLSDGHYAWGLIFVFPSMFFLISFILELTNSARKSSSSNKNDYTSGHRFDREREKRIATSTPMYNTYSNPKKHYPDLLIDILFELNEYTVRGDYLEIPIRGINFRNLTKENIGVFGGYIMRDEGNQYDKYAIGVYSLDGTHFGYLKKGQKILYDKIEKKQGLFIVELEVSTFTLDGEDELFSGKVIINIKDLL